MQTGWYGLKSCPKTNRLRIFHQVSDTHERLVLQLEDISDSPECEQRTEEDRRWDGGHMMASAAGGGGGGGGGGSAVMRDWLLVAAGIERFFFLIYTLAFGIVSSVYM